MKRKVEQYLKDTYGADAAEPDPHDGHYKFEEKDIEGILASIRERSIKKERIATEKKPKLKKEKKSATSSVLNTSDNSGYDNAYIHEFDSTAQEDGKGTHIHRFHRIQALSLPLLAHIPLLRYDKRYTELRGPAAVRC